MAIVDAQSTAVTFEDNLAAAQTITRKISVNGPGPSVTVKDRTTLEDTTYEVKAPGLLNANQVEIEVYHDLSDAGQAALDDAMDNRHTRELVITYSDASTTTCQAFVSASTGPQAQVNGDVTNTYTLEISGAPVKA